MDAIQPGLTPLVSITRCPFRRPDLWESVGVFEKFHYGNVSASARVAQRLVVAGARVFCCQAELYEDSDHGNVSVAARIAQRIVVVDARVVRR
jgi:hypothetical protein